MRRLIVTDLPVNHVAHGHADLHAGPLHMVEVEVVQDSQAHGGQRDAGSIAVGFIGRSCVGGVIVLKVLDYLPQ